ncbi:DsbA family protein [Thermodesulfobacteriota bacterium]
MAAVRLQQVVTELPEPPTLFWLGFPMIPGLGGPALFRSDVDQSRIRAADEAPNLTFIPWTDGDALPSESIPALLAGHCAKRQGDAAFDRFHFDIFRAYFELNRDISDQDVLLDIAGGAGLDVKRLKADMGDGQALSELEQRRESLIEKGDFTGVPTVFFGDTYPMIGAVPIQVYQRAAARLIN